VNTAIGSSDGSVVITNAPSTCLSAGTCTSLTVALVIERAAVHGADDPMLYNGTEPVEVGSQSSAPATSCSTTRRTT